MEGTGLSRVPLMSATRVYFGRRNNNKRHEPRVYVREPDSARAQNLNYKDTLWRIFKFDWGRGASVSHRANLAIRLVCHILGVPAIVTSEAARLVVLMRPVVEKLESENWTLTEAQIQNELAQQAILQEANPVST